MEFTGERYMPNVGGMIALEHWHRYVAVKELVRGKSVLDIASGEGYGSFLLADAAQSVIGIDLSDEAVLHAQSQYQLENLKYLQGDCTQIPLESQSVDCVVSFETLEHHDKHEEMMAEVKRVLRPGGLLIISTPDRYEYTDVPQRENCFHVKELYYAEFESLLKQYFSNINMLGQRIVYGSALFDGKNAAKILTYDFNAVGENGTAGLAKPLYWIALASDEALPLLSHSLMEQPLEEIQTPYIRQCEAKVKHLESTIANQEAELARTRSLLLEIRESLSWRMTYPLRAVSRIFRK